MSPSRALLDGVLKYKRLHRDRGGDTHHFITMIRLKFSIFVSAAPTWRSSWEIPT